MRFDRSKYNKCSECPLRDRKRVFGEGPEGTVKIALYGEAPGRDEDLAGKPFVGPAGKMLNYALHRASILRHKCWISNIICCRPTDNNMDTEEAQEAVRSCRPGFLKELKYLKEHSIRVIMPLGNHALFAFNLESGITKRRGSIYKLPLLNNNVIALPTFHPSFIQRGQWKQEVTWINDFVKAKGLTKKIYKAPVESFNIYPTIGDLEAFRDEAKANNSILAVDIETTALNPQYSDIVVIGFALNEQKAISFPIFKQGMKRYWKNGDQAKAIKILRELLQFPTMFQNCMFDVQHLRAHGFKVDNIVHDTMLIHHAFHPELPHDIGYIVSVYGKTSYWKSGVLNKDVPIGELPDKMLRTYNLRDVVVLHQVLQPMLNDLKGADLLPVYETSMKLIHPVMSMMANGMLLDKKALTTWKASLNRKVKRLEKKLREITKVPEAFSFDSGDHIRLLVYGYKAPQFKKAVKDLNIYEDPNCKLKKNTKKYQAICDKIDIIEEVIPLSLPINYKTRRKTKSGAWSTDEETLLGIQIACNNRFALIKKFVRQESYVVERKALEIALQFFKTFNSYKETFKLLSTYTSFPVGKGGRVYPNYLIHGTKTGRLSSRKPNAQNTPKEARKLFVARPGYKIVQADYSNLELRILAHESNDDVLIKVFEKGLNVHDENTKDLFDLKKGDKFFDLARRAAKIYIFGRNYGGGLQGIYRRVMKEVPELGLTFQKFSECDRAYRNRHPRYMSWYRRTVTEVTKNKKLTSAFKRTRIFLGLEMEITREGLNFLIQSPAADIINKVTISLYDELLKGMFLLGQMHDALLFEIRKDLIDRGIRLIKKHMEQKIDYRGKVVSFPVDIEIGDNWGDLQKYEIKTARTIQRSRRKK